MSSLNASSTKLFEEFLRTVRESATPYQVIGLALVVIAAMWILGPRAGDTDAAKDPWVGRIMVGAPMLVVLMFLLSLKTCDVGPSPTPHDPTSPRPQGQPEAPQAASQTVRPTEERTPQPQPKTEVTPEAAAKINSTETSADNKNSPEATEARLHNRRLYTLPFNFGEYKLDPKNETIVQAIVDYSLSHRSLTIRVIGNDETTGESFSEARRRADLVRKGLEEKGVEQNRITIGAAGKDRSEDAGDCKGEPLSSPPKRAVVVFLCE